MAPAPTIHCWWSSMRLGAKSGALVGLKLRLIGGGSILTVHIMLHLVGISSPAVR